MNPETLLNNREVRASGLWRVIGTDLVQEAFHAQSDMPVEVAESFASATRRVELSQTAFGIVGAVIDGIPRISIAAELTPDSGSGLWLRRFGADFSIAMPLRCQDGGDRVLAVAIVGVVVEAWLTRLRLFAESAEGSRDGLDS